ncbi:MAG: FecR domain-containing protein [Deltaproteobacteria bacterium]|nr:FecR domain-containing protein [Deltaproteobacteria bacterium]
MTCEHADALYRHPWPGQTSRERETLREHASACAACGATVRRLESARRLLMDDVPLASRREDAATWAAVEARIEARSSLWRWPAWVAVPAAAAALVAALMLRPTAPEAYTVTAGALATAEATVTGGVPSDAPLSATVRTRIEGEGAVLTLEPGAQARLRSRDLWALEYGDLAVEVQPTPAAPLTVLTEAARVSGVGTHFRVSVADGETRVSVSRGQVRVESKGAPALTVGAGAEWSSRPAPPPLAPSTEPAVAPSQARPDAARRAEDRAAVDRARALVTQDALRARRIAGEVLERRAAGPEEVDALAVIADAHRLSGEHRAAASFYARVAAHPAGVAYAEEARLRQAQMLMALGEHRAALDALALDDPRLARGALAPERAALAAQAWLRLGEPDRAAAALESADPRSLAVQDARRAVQRALEGGQR